MKKIFAMFSILLCCLCCAACSSGYSSIEEAEADGARLGECITIDGVNITENLQLESGTTATEYEPYTETTATAVLDTALGENDYIDIIEKKRYTNGTEVSDITVEGELKTADSSICEIECQTNVQPSKISTEYYQDINKVITEIKNAVLSQGGNV